MSERFFSSEPITARRVTLEGAEAHHLLHVMRGVVGQRITLFDGSGAEFAAIVESLGRSSVALQIVQRQEISRELPFTVTVGVALPKGDRQKWLVEKLTELGMSTLVPLVAERGVAQPMAGAIEKLRRATIEAAKQCGRNRLLQIAAPQTLTTWLSNESIAGDLRSPDLRSAEHRRLIAHPCGKPLFDFDLTRPLPTQVSIGPEGGFTDSEIAAAQDAGWQTVDLGPRILRVETAAVALSAAIALCADSGCRPTHSAVD
jgi:16S rRNA (uracil1498-N3)-methyltransferase